MSSSELSHIQAVGLDLDGNLTKAFTSLPLEGVHYVLNMLRARKLILRVLTNQAGRTWGLVTGNKQYPDATKLAMQLNEAATLLGLRDVPWYISVYDSNLLRVIARQHELAAVDADADHPELAMPDDPAEEAREELEQYARQVKIELETLFASYGLAHWQVSADPTWRKPLPGMLGAMSAETGVPIARIAYVGDMDGSREIPKGSGRFPDSDKRFAEAAGCAYFASSMEAFLAALEGRA